jgi:nitroreductase
MTTHLPIEHDALNQLFSEARTHSVWQDKPVSDELLKHVYDLCKMGATSANCQPLRIVFVKTAAEKEKLLSCLYEGNIEKTKTAPVTALFAYDMKFFEHLPDLFPHVDARPWFTQNETDTYTHSFRNANLQAAYFMIAARALGLDCGPMSGFIEDKMNAEFFAGTNFRVSFICNLGYGDAEAVYERLPRLDFDVACKII